MQKSLCSRESKLRFVAMAVASAALTGFGSVIRANTIAQWTFETTPARLAGAPGANNTFTGTGGAITADGGDEANTSGVVATGLHVGAATYSAPAGNGSVASFSSNVWAVNDYYEFDINSAGYTGIQLTFDQTGSATGPKAFKIEYNAGSGWTDLASGAYNVANTTTFTSSSNTSASTTTGGSVSATSIGWNTSASGSNPASALSFDLSSISGLTGIRIVDTSSSAALGTSSAVGSGGTDRIDNVTFTGTSAAPEPASVAVVAAGAGLLIGRRRRK